MDYYDNDELKFEGEYLKGERNGKGKEYYENGNLLFEGEYLNGKKNGKGKEYNIYNGLLIFEGEYSDDKRNGFGKIFFDGELVQTGLFQNGEQLDFFD